MRVRMIFGSMKNTPSLGFMFKKKKELNEKDDIGDDLI